MPDAEGALSGVSEGGLGADQGSGVETTEFGAPDAESGVYRRGSRARRPRGRDGAPAGRAPTSDTAERTGDYDERSDEDWASEGRAILLRQLAVGPRSRHQLGVKLAERDVPPPIASALLDRFEEVLLIDDAEFARMWVRTRSSVRGLSRSSIRRELADKGIDSELAEDALLQVSDEDEHDQARDIVQRKLRRGVDLTDRAVRDKEMRRLVGVLARKGYNPGAAFAIVKDVMSASERTD